MKEFDAEWSILEELSRNANVTRINEVALSTPICVALQISLVRLLRAWGIEPVAVTSHSSGEMAAAYAAGAISYRMAMAFSYHRALLAADKKLRGPVQGAMIAVGLGLEETESYLRRLTSEGKAVVACINSPSSITVAGDLPAIVKIEELAAADDVFVRRLKVDTAWHSHQMAALACAYADALERIEPKDHGSDTLHSVTFSSSVTGGRMTNAKDISRPKHWVKSLVQPVQFVSAFTDMVLGETGTSASNVDIIVEVGPHTALGGPIQQILSLPEFKGLKIQYYGSLVRKVDARDSMQALASILLKESCPVDMEAVNFAHDKGQHVKVLTGLPSYPWNHQVKHWVEPRSNKALRERSQPPHDLLGSLAEGSNPETPSWRHHLRIADSPWTKDHAIQANVVYPAAGYICLAIEAIRQSTKMDHLTTNGRIITGYRARDVDFLQALMIPDSSDGIEIQTTIRPVSDKDVGVPGSKHFEVWTVTADNRWTHHAKGLISVEFEGSSLKTVKRSRDIKGYTRRVTPADLFANLRKLGIAHGPMFQNMKTIVQSGLESRSVVTMAVPDTSIPEDLPRDHILHPVTLDSVITAPYSAIPGAAAHEIAAKVPRSIGSFWVSNNISHQAEHLLKADSSIIRNDSQGITADVSVSSNDSGSVVLEIKDLTYQSLGRGMLLDQTNSWEKELCNTVNWSLDISVRSPVTIESVKKQFSCNTNPFEGELTQNIRRVCVYFMQKALLVLSPQVVDRMEPHHAKYHLWMNDIVQQAASGLLCTGSAEWLADKEPERQCRIEQVAKARVDGETACRLGAELVAILQGQTTPLEVLTRDNLLSRFESETPKVKRIGSQLSGLLRHLVHKNPRARILEIGAGTGAITRYALDVLGTAESGGPHASHYHYTDISENFFKAAREEFSAWSNLLVFDTLDIERDAADQGFVNGSYDIVIAYATKSVSRALDNVRSLLRPGGTLLMTEDVQCQVEFQFVNGLFSTWWVAEEPEREANPLLSTVAWEHHLRLAGFAGPNITLHDSENPEASTSITIMSTAPLPLALSPENIVIVTSEKAGSPPASWLKDLQDSIAVCAKGDKELSIVQDLESSYVTAEWYADKICIFVGEVHEPILYDLDTASLDGIRTMSTSCKGLLWNIRGGAVRCERPELGLAPGFIRALRNEYVGRKLMTLDLDPNGPVWSEAGRSAIVQIMQATFSNPKDGAVIERGPAELEYAERDGMILVPRFYHDVTRNKALSLRSSDFEMQESKSIEPFYRPERPICLHSDLVAFGDDSYATAYRDGLEPRLVEVEPRAYGTTATHEHIKGLECAGIINRVGSEAAAQGYSVGDRVLCVLRQSSFPSRAIVEWTSTVRIPTDLSFHEAVSLPMAFLTAYFSLVETARLRRAQSVLIHDAAKDVGQVAIMIAQHIGAEIFATIGNSEERELITQKYSIPTDHLFSSRDASFGVDTLAATKNRGVDVVLNSLAGPLMQESFNLVAPLGYFVTVDKHDLETNSNLAMRPFTRGISFLAVDIPSLLEHRSMDVHRYLGEITRLVKAKALTPVQPITSYGIKDIVEASRHLKTESHMGKLVLTIGADEQVPTIPHNASAKLSPDASYLIVGGNGGLGQSVAHWMVSRGAKNLVLVSRSAGKSEKIAALAEELREAGCSRVLPVSCDISNDDDVANAIYMCGEEELPPIRGIVHAAFVLHVSGCDALDFSFTCTT